MQQHYSYYKTKEQDYTNVLKLLREGMSISSIGRYLSLARTTILRMIQTIASQTKMTPVKEEDQEYEVDELYTYTKHKRNECWIMYAINKATGRVIDFTVGRRTKANLKKVIDSLVKLNPRKIFTDSLNIYPKLICAELHIATSHKTNRIERKNLNLRKDLKCLNRKTICYSKNEQMLEAKLRLYFFR